MTTKTRWQKEFATIEDLWRNADADPERGIVVALNQESDDEMGIDSCFGAALIDDTWFRVVRIGDGDWRGCWSDRQQRFETIEDESMVSKLNDFAGF